MATLLPVLPAGVRIFDPVTGAPTIEFQNFLVALNAFVASTTGAPNDAEYYVATSNGTLTNERNLGALSTGFLFITVGAGVAAPSSVPTIPLARGGTHTDLSATGGTSQVLKQVTAGADITVGQLQASDLSNYAVGTWTPADSSGASLTLTVNSANYVRIGSLVGIQADITYPVTADGSNSQINGLPFTSIAAKYALGVGGNLGSAYEAVVNASAQTINFLSVAGVRLLNSALTGANLSFSGVYRT